jgi:hypothetical protein
MSSVLQARHSQDPEEDVDTCPLCDHPCKRGLYTLQTRDGSRRSVCAGCWVAVATEPRTE